jgi:hypothetical protein
VLIVIVKITVKLTAPRNYLRKEKEIMQRSLLAITVVLGLVTILASGCVYLNVQRPLDENFDKTDLGTKVGKSEVESVLWLFAWGDGGTRAAADNGGIKIIKHADTAYQVFLFGLYARVTTVVYGD